MILENSVNKLLDYQDDTSYITSLYLRLGPDERKNFKYKTTLKNLIKQAKKDYSCLENKIEEYKSIEKDLVMIENYIDNSKKVEGFRGIAIFSCSSNNLWEVFKLPLVNKDRIFFNNYPHIGELISLNDKYGNTAFLVIDKNKARFFNLTLDGVQELSGFLYPGASRTHRFQSPEGKFKQRVSSFSGGRMVYQGYGEYSFNRTIENDIHQHFKYISDSIFDYYKDNKFDWLILGGSNQIVQDFSHHIHPYLKSKLLGNIKLDVDTIQTDQLFDMSLNLLHDLRFKNNCKLLEEFEEKLSSDLAVNGIESSLNSLYNGQARTLLINEGFRQPGFICPKSNLLVLENNERLCPELQAPNQIQDIVDYIIEEAFSQKCEVEIIYAPELKKKIDGMGAILRFKL
jgi:peptide chain release factor subunit 1